MRLCLISHAYLEGGYRHVLETLAARPGVELAWITPNSYKLNLQTSSGECTETSTEFRTYAVPIRWGGRQGTFVYHNKPLEEALQDFKPDIILHEQEVFALGAGQIAHIAVKYKIPLVMFVNENVYRSLSWLRRRLVCYVLRRSDALIPISQGAEDVHRFWGFKGPSAIIAQIGVLLHDRPAFGRRQPGVLSLCFAGQLIPAKGIDCLLRAVAVLSADSVPVRCTIAGKGVEYKELLVLCRSLGIEHLVKFAGLLLPAKVKELFQQTDVLVLPSRRTKVWEEQFGRVLVEAMAQATVTVGSRTGAIAEVIGSEEMLFDENDFIGLAKILKLLAEDVSLLESQQRRVWERIRKYYESKAVTQRKVAFLQQILDGRKQLVPVDPGSPTVARSMT